MKKKKAIITGITGQGGSYLAELLLEKDYKVYGMKRRTSTESTSRISHILEDDDLEIIDGDLLDQGSIDRAVQQVQPDEFYNLGAQSFVGASWNQPINTMDITGLGPVRCLEAIRKHGPKTKFFQASSSEMFGKVVETPQKETTPFYPRSPYGIAKLNAHWATVNYRESYNMFACSGICFNYESEKRGLEFVTRKITDGVARIFHGKSNHIALGNLEARRDWGFAGDVVRAFWMMLQNDKPEDFVISTGETHSIREFLDIAFAHIGIDDWSSHVVQDPAFMRPAEVDILLGDSAEIKQKLGWKPEVSFENLVREMVENDILIHSKGNSKSSSHSVTTKV